MPCCVWIECIESKPTSPFVFLLVADIPSPLQYLRLILSTHICRSGGSLTSCHRCNSGPSYCFKPLVPHGSRSRYTKNSRCTHSHRVTRFSLLLGLRVSYARGHASGNVRTGQCGTELMKGKSWLRSIASCDRQFADP